VGKRILASLLAVVCFTARAQAQKVGIAPLSALRPAEVRDSALLNVLLNASVLAERDLDRATGLSVRVLIVPGESGSAQTEDTDEVVSWLYVGVSEFGEVVQQRAYRVGPVYDPKIDRIVAEGRTPVVYLSYGARNTRHHSRVAVDLNGIHIQPRRP
jgi:hypothetical protein